MRRTITRFLVAFLLATMAVGCAGRDLNALCEIATEAEKDRTMSPAEKAAWISKRLDDDLSTFGDIREAMKAIVHADPAAKYEILLHVAKETGHEDWRCPAVERMMAPQEGPPAP